MLLRQVRCFLAVARGGSFSAAARALNLSQPSLGVHIRQLEQRYRVRLFERGARGARLTPAGERLLPRAEALLAEAEGVEALLRELGQATPLTLTLGVTPTAEATFAHDLLRRSSGAGPPVSLVLVPGLSEELRRRTEAGELDAALCYGGLEDEWAGTVLPLYEEDLFLVGPPAVLEPGRPVPFAELARFPLVLERRFQALRRLIDGVAAAEGVRLDVRQEAEPASVKRALIRQHGCSTIVPYGLFIDDIRLGRMAAHRIVDPPLRRTMYLVRRRNLPAPVSALLTGWLDEIVRETIAADELHWRPRSRAASS